MADRKKPGIASKSAPKGCGKKCTNIADKYMATLGVELANSKALHLHCLEVTTRPGGDANKTRTDLQDSQASQIEAEPADKMA